VCEFLKQSLPLTLMAVVQERRYARGLSLWQSFYRWRGRAKKAALRRVDFEHADAALHRSSDARLARQLRRWYTRIPAIHPW